MENNLMMIRDFYDVYNDDSYDDLYDDNLMVQVLWDKLGVNPIEMDHIVPYNYKYL